MSDNGKTEFWGIVELMGHNQIAGFVSEATIGGSAFVRVDVPDNNNLPGFTKYYGSGAIFAMHPCTEEMARQAAENIHRHNTPLPVHVPDLSDARDVIRRAERAAEFLREQESRIKGQIAATASRATDEAFRAVETRSWDGDEPDYYEDPGEDEKPF